MRTYWDQLSTPTAIAFEEIRHAARTDAALAAVLKPLEEEYQARWDVRAVDIFADWQSDPERFELAITLAQTVLEGLALRNRSGLANDHVVEMRSEEHTSELQSLMRNSYAVFCLKK